MLLIKYLIPKKELTGMDRIDRMKTKIRIRTKIISA
jgi:hypothetical protein